MKNKKWYLMVSGTFFPALILWLVSDIFTDKKEFLRVAAFIGLLIGGSITAKMLENK